MKKILFMVIILLSLIYCSAAAENLTVNGNMGSRLRFEIKKTVMTFPGVKTLTISFVVPGSFESPTYKQNIDRFDLKFTPAPQDERKLTDPRGNRIITASWKSPPETIDAHLTFNAVNETKLPTIDTSAPFPMKKAPEEISYYLKASKQVQSDDPRIKDLSKEIIQGVNTEFEAVQRILTFVVDSIHYVTPPTRHDAIYSLESGRGNCQNFSHLSAALMRSSGIPVRIINGVTLNKPMEISRDGGGTLTLKMGQGRHSWIEVWFPDIGWVPFDPQQTGMFVSNRFIRIEVGIDNNETINDGLVRWSQATGSHGELSDQEIINADFITDNVKVNSKREEYGPKNFLLFPLVRAEAKQAEMVTPTPSDKTTQTEVALPTPSGKAKPAEAEQSGFLGNFWRQVKRILSKVALKPPSFFSKIREGARITFKSEKGDVVETAAIPDQGPVIFGNLDFPVDIDFAFPPAPAVSTGENSFEKARSFFVETAEYVTSQRTQYAQVFILTKPLKLEKIGLALHKFGGEGQLWVDIYRDDNGKPGEIIAASEIVDLGGLSEKPGYRWADFSFAAGIPVISPGNYWIGLGFTGSPIVNWFYTYGKPVGPEEGTRYKGVFDNDWSGALSYEFNYRVAGLVVK
jgi:hypothetical protein